MSSLNLPPSAIRAVDNSNGDAAVPGSLLSKLKDAAGRQREERTLTLDVPGAFAGLMRIRYHGVALQEIERYGELIAAGQTTEVSAGIDMLATCCDAVLGLDDDGEWIEIAHALDDDFARTLDMPRPAPDAELSPREVVSMLFTVGDNNAPLTTHAGQLWQWLINPTVDPGESSAATRSSRSVAPRRSESTR